MEFLERQAETRHDDVAHAHTHAHDEPAGVGAAEEIPVQIPKPEPLLDDSGRMHQPDCTFQADAPAAQCGCCSVVPEANFKANAPGGDKKDGADSSGGDSSSGGSSSGSSGGSSGSSGGSSGSSGGSSGSSGGSNAAGATDASGDKAQQQGSTDKSPAKVTAITFNPVAGPAISIAAKTYQELYEAIAAKASLSKEGGKVEPDAPDIQAMYKDGVTKEDVDSGDEKRTPIDTCTVTVDLKVSLPEWTGKGNVTPDEEAKWQKWYNGVKAHEDKHIAAFKKVTAANIKPTGPYVADVKAALKAAWSANDAAQQAVDATPPPPLEIKGGTSKIGPDGKETPASTDGAQASAAGEEGKQKEGESSPGSAHTPPAGGSGSQPSAPSAQA